MQATPIQNALTVRNAETLPDGAKVVTIDVADYMNFINTPHAIEYDGQVYGRTGWNSDKFVAYYRTDKKVARVINASR